MIYYLILLLNPLTGCIQTVSQKQYNLKKQSPNAILFSAVTSLIALFFFLITSGFQLDFNIRLFPYALAFAVAYSAAWVGTLLAVRYGLIAITTLVVSCSLIFPTIYGIIMGETVTPAIVVGILMLLAALVLVNLKFSQKEKFSLKWLVCTLIAFLGNGVCSISQNLQKRALGDSYSHEFMIIALVASVILLMAYAAFTSKNFLADFKGCLLYSTVNGVCNGVGNFVMLTVIGNIPNTILYPTNSALGMVSTFLLAFFAYKERFSWVQYLGYGLGMLSIILLNL